LNGCILTTPAIIGCSNLSENKEIDAGDIENVHVNMEQFVSLVHKV